MRYDKKNFTVLATDAVELAQICGLTAPKYIKWRQRGDIVELFKKYNRGRGKVSKNHIIEKLTAIPKGEYAAALNKLIAYVETA